MTSDDLHLKTISTRRIEPGSAKLIRALRALGYTFDQAVADIVDNSIAAKAKNVLLAFVTEGEELKHFVIADDGEGMSEGKLDEAMRFGSADDYDEKSLGKYGLGLKLASLSHAATFEVLTREGGRSLGRRWTVEGLSNDWQCELLDDKNVGRVMDGLHPDLRNKPSGTLIVWHQIDRMNLGRQGVRKGLEVLTRRLHNHLGLHFHRFLESDGVSISTEARTLGREFILQRQKVRAINPFKYPASGHEEYPKVQRVDIPGCGSLSIKACVWPPNSKSSEYKLGGKAAQRQGFYFYRRDRLIQAGGWNGVVEHETDPHSSLARLAIDLPESLENSFGLNVQKSRVVTPPAFVSALTDARDNLGDPWLTKYRKAADQAYRHDDRVQEEYPLVPADGLPTEIAVLARDELADGRQRRIRGVRFEWATLAGPDFFEVDRDRLVIRLNKNYRTAVLAGRRGTAADAPLLKLLLFFVLESEFDRDRLTAARKTRLDAINRLLSEAVEHEAR